MHCLAIQSVINNIIAIFSHGNGDKVCQCCILRSVYFSLTYDSVDCNRLQFIKLDSDK